MISSNVTPFATPIIYRITGVLTALIAARFILPFAITSKINSFCQNTLALTSRFISLILTGSSTLSLNDRLHYLTNENKRLSDEITVLSNQIRTSNWRSSSDASFITNLKKQLETQTKTLSELRSQLNTLATALKDAETLQTTSSQEIGTLKDLLAAEKETVIKLQEELALLQKEKERLQKDCNRPEVQVLKTEKSLQDLEKAIADLNAQRSALIEEMEAAESALMEAERKTKDITLNSLSERVLRFSLCMLKGQSPEQPIAKSDLSGRLQEQFTTEVDRLKGLCKKRSTTILENSEKLLKDVEAFRKAQAEILQQVEDILKKHVEYVSEKRPAQKGRLLREKQEQVTALTNYLKQNNIEAPLNEPCEEDEPSMRLINEIKKCEKKLNQEVERLEQERLISQYRPSEDLTKMEPRRILNLYRDCHRKDTILNNLQKTLDKLIDRANLKGNRPDYGINIQFIGNERAPFQISSAQPLNVSMGYSIFNLLCEAKIIPSGQEWNGEQTFLLQEEDLNKLSDYLGRVDSLFDNFFQGMGALLSVPDPEEYINVGQKQAYEILVSAKRCTAEGKKTLAYLPGNHLCLLLGQVGLNLEKHPDRDFIKDRLTKIYRQEEMKSFDGKYKQFVIGTYQTNLSTADMKQIESRLNKLLKFLRYLMEKSGKSSFKQALEHFQRQGKAEFDLLKEYYTEITIAALNFFVQDEESIRRQIELKFRQISADIAITSDNFQTLAAREIRSVDSLEKACEEIWAIYLKRKTAPHFKKQAPSYTPSQDAITALYGTTAKKSYGHTHDVFRDLKGLFASLKQSETVQAILGETPEIEPKLDGLREALEERLTNKYLTLPERGWPSSRELIRQAINSLEIYVASVVNRGKSRVSEESIKTSLAQITGLDIGELKKGCDEGLTGRILSLSIALSNDMGGGLEASITQQQKELLESALFDFTQAESYNTFNSSHAPVYLAELRNYLGIAIQEGEEEKTYATLSPNAKKMFKFFLEKNQPMDIYKTAKGFFEHSLLLETHEIDNEANREKMYQTLSDLGFGDNREELDRKYRIQGNRENGWEYNSIAQDLPKYLPSYLIQKGFLVVMDSDALERCLYCRNAKERTVQSIREEPPAVYGYNERHHYRN